MHRYVAAIALAALILTIAACGADSPPASAPADIPEGGAPPVEATAGDVLRLGEKVVTDYVDYAVSTDRKTKLGVTVLKVRKGRISDFKGFKLDAKQRKAVPYYVDVNFENAGKFALTRSVIQPSIEDAGGQEYRPTTLIVVGGTFRPCPEYSPKKLGAGESFTGCSPFFLPKGKDFGRVRFQGVATEDPVFWEAR